VVFAAEVAQPRCRNRCSQGPHPHCRLLGDVVVEEAAALAAVVVVAEGVVLKLGLRTLTGVRPFQPFSACEVWPSPF
jgi:hypothetical protein